MSDQNEVNTPSSVESWKTLAIGAPIFCISNGCLFLASYWGSFDINIFQYISVADVVASAMVPLLILLVAQIPGLLIGARHGKRMGHGIAESSHFPKIAKVLVWFKWPAYIIFFTIFLLIGVSDLKLKPILLALFGSLVIAHFLAGKRIKILSGISDEIQFRTVFFGAMLLLFSFALGNIFAKVIIDGERFIYVVESDIKQLKTAEHASFSTSVRYIGHVSEYDFFYNPISKDVAIAKARDEHFLVLKLHVDEKSDPVFIFLRTINEKISDIFSIQSTAHPPSS